MKSKDKPEKKRVGKEIFSFNQSDLHKVNKQIAKEITK